MDSVVKLFQHVFSLRIANAILASIVLALLLTTTIGFSLEALGLIDRYPYVQVNDVSTVTTIYISSLIVLLTLIIFFTFKEIEDIYTPLRKMVKGIWRVTYQTWGYDEDGKVVEHSSVEVCTIGIDITTAKLYFRIQINASDLYEACELRIDDIAINPSSSPKRLAYYYLMNMKLRDDKRILLGLDNSQVSFPIFGILRLDEDRKGDLYEKMEGEWYDLNDTYSDQLEQLFKQKLGDVELPSLPRRGMMTFLRVREEN
jgi:hypothetical protein